VLVKVLATRVLTVRSYPPFRSYPVWR